MGVVDMMLFMHYEILLLKWKLACKKEAEYKEDIQNILSKSPDEKIHAATIDQPLSAYLAGSILQEAGWPNQLYWQN